MAPRPKIEPATKPIPIPPETIRYVPSDKPFRTVRDWLRGLGPIDSLLDVGCGSSIAVTWGAARHRYSIDPRDRPPLPNVTAYRGLFPDDWQSSRHTPCAVSRMRPTPEAPILSVILCLDVLQDAHRPAKLAADLLAIADRVIVSIPLSRGPDPLVILDPLERLETWFGQRARQEEIERTRPARLIAEFLRFKPVIGQRVLDRDGVAYTFESWTAKQGKRYANIRDRSGKRHQVAERQLRSA